METGRIIGNIIGYALYIWIIVACINKAKKLNRNPVGWGIFAFLLPLVALIWIQFMSPKKEKVTGDEVLDDFR